MSNSDKGITPFEEENEELEIAPINPPQNKMQGILEELEVLALHKGKSGGIDLSNFTEQQTDKLLDILSKNEDNAFAFHTERLKASKEIEIKRIDSTTLNQKTIRIIVIGLMVSIPVVTLLIMFYRQEYFIPWLTFLAGLAGGTGINKISQALFKTPDKNPLADAD